VKHVLASEIYSQAHVGQTKTRLVANGSKEAEEQGGMARLTVVFPKVDRSMFEKSKFKTFEKGVDSRVGMVG